MTDPDAEPAGDILYGAKVQKRCTMRNGDVITLERECGYNYFLNQYMTSGDKFVCPGVSCVVLKCSGTLNQYVLQIKGLSKP